MTIDTMEPIVSSSALIALEESVRPSGAHLPISAWNLQTRVQPNGRTVAEISNDLGSLEGLVTSTRLAILSVDGAWRGRGYNTNAQLQWWALAVGRASASDDEPTVTFTRRVGHRGSPRRTVLRPTLFHGLWVAAIPGLYTTVSCEQGPRFRIRRLAATRSIAR
jgi:hypothetical protein